MAIRDRGTKFEVKVGGKYYGTFDTRAAAQLCEAKTRVARATSQGQGLPAAVQVRTCSDFADVWIEHYRPTAAVSTVRNYQTAMRRFKEQFGDTPLNAIDRPAARRWAKLQKPGTRIAVSAMMNDAVEDRFAVENPFSALKIKRSRGRKDLEANWLTRDEVHALADSALDSAPPGWGPMIRSMILFGAYTGIRPGEAFALRWKDVDAKAGRIHVRKSLAVDRSIKAPKNGRARTIVMAPEAYEAIKHLPRPTGVPYVFTTRKGTAMSRGTLDRAWHLVRAAAHRPGMDFYELRHFCATYLLKLGLTPDKIAVQLGHLDGGLLVMSTYMHPSEDEARDAIAEAFRKAA